MAEAVEAQLEQCERDGLISPSSSPYQSPIVVVHKKDGSIRVCCDYSEFKKIVKPHDYPLPNIHKIWYAQVGARYYETADLRSNQMLVVPEHVPFTAFGAPSRKCETVAAFFGMRNTPPYIQQAMDVTISELERDEELTQYIDDSQFHRRDGAESAAPSPIPRTMPGMGSSP